MFDTNLTRKRDTGDTNSRKKAKTTHEAEEVGGLASGHCAIAITQFLNTGQNYWQAKKLCVDVETDVLAIFSIVDTTPLLAVAVLVAIQLEISG